MAVKINDVEKMPVLNCIGTVKVATKEGSLLSYQKPGDDNGPGKLIIAFDFEADPYSTGKSLRRYVWLDPEQFNPHNDGADFSSMAKAAWNNWFMGGPAAKGVGLCAFLTADEGLGWLGKLEQYYDSETGLTDMAAIGQEIAAHIDGKSIGYQCVQKREFAGSYDDAGKKIYALQRDYEIGDVFFDPLTQRPPRSGQNTFSL